MDESRTFKSPNDNPWYVLATLYGEGFQNGDTRNRGAWNAWAGQKMTESERVATASEVQRNVSRAGRALGETSGAPSVEELSAWNEKKEEISVKFAKEWRRRNGQSATIPQLPEPDAKINFSGFDFGNGICLDGFVFNATVNFSNSRINSRGTFSNATFRGVASFHNTEFNSYARFDGAYFAGTAKFSKAKLFGSSTFICTKFNSSVEFSSATLEAANFDHAEFAASANFSQMTIFYGTFRQARFLSFSSFYGAAFFGSVSFLATEFISKTEDYADFSKATFENDADFRDISFLSLSKFESVEFKGQALFPGAKFQASALFSSAHFCGGTTFKEAEFHGEAIFRVAKFYEEVEFCFTQFNGGVQFDRTSFNSLTSFYGADFLNENSNGVINFSNCNFCAPATFRKAVFRKFFPVFTGALMHDRTVFTGDKEYWPSTVDHNLEEAREACAAIRNLLDKQGLHVDAHFFFRREMGFRGCDERLLRRLPYVAYGWISDYGYSIYRPAVGLFALWLTGFLVVFFDRNLDKVREAWKLRDLSEIGPGPQWEFALPAGVSVANSLPFLGMGRLMYRDFYEAAAFYVKMFSALQSLLAAVFIFLIALGLRTRLRMS